MSAKNSISGTSIFMEFEYNLSTRIAVYENFCSVFNYENTFY